MKKTLLLLAALASFSGTASAVLCGTIAAPTSCSITVGGVATYTFTNFDFAASSAGGGGFQYTADDVEIELTTGGGLSALLGFRKRIGSPTPGIVFLANPGNTTAFSFTYDLLLNAAAPGAVALADPLILSMVSSSAGNGLSSVQWAASGAATCLVFTGSVQDNCTLPPGTGTSLSAGHIVSLSGNSGNTSIIEFASLYNASFTPGGQVGEPPALALLALGLAGWAAARRRSGRGTR